MDADRSKLPPKITVRGLYSAGLWDGELRDELERYYFFGNAREDMSGEVVRYVERCTPLVLLDLTIDGADERFDLADFTQEMIAVPRRVWQAAYDEAVLSPDGCRIVARNTGCTKGLQSGRIAFYFHFFDPSKPMRWTYGEFSCPVVQPVPVTLLRMLPYKRFD